MSHRAEFNSNQAWLSGDFGESMARRYFGDEIVDSMPRYVRGKRKGKLKGKISWRKVTRGGWVRTGPYCEDGGASGYVERRVGKIIDVELSIPQWRDEPIFIAKWEWSEYYMNDRDRAVVIKNEAA